MWNMDRQSVLIGEIVIDQEPRIALYAQTDIPISREGIAVLKDKLAYLLDSRFRPAEPPAPRREMTISEVIETWHCYRSTVLRFVREGLLHPTQVNGDLRFDRLEVLSLEKLVPERP